MLLISDKVVLVLQSYLLSCEVWSGQCLPKAKILWIPSGWLHLENSRSELTRIHSTTVWSPAQTQDAAQWRNCARGCLVPTPVRLCGYGRQRIWERDKCRKLAVGVGSCFAQITFENILIIPRFYRNLFPPPSFFRTFHRADLPAPVWASVGSYCSFLAICFCHMLVCTSDKSFWASEKLREVLPFLTPTSLLQSQPLLQSRQLPNRQGKGTRPTGQADVGCGALNLQKGMLWPWSNPSGTAKALVALERKAFLSEKLARERKTVKLKVWHLCYWPSFSTI